MRIAIAFLLAVSLAVLSGCASMTGRGGSPRQAGSVVDYLYPDARQAPTLQPTLTRLRLPVRVGVAFVPGTAGGAGLTGAGMVQALERVKSSFSKYDYIGKIEIIPSGYMRPRGGFTNLDQVAAMFDVDVVALISYDQVRFSDSNSLSVLYWTIVGAYVIRGDKYDVQTLVDASVFDVRSRKLLFRAPGTSQVKGSATMANFSEKARNAQAKGFDEAIDQMIPQLQAQLDDFRTRAKSDPNIAIERNPGQRGGGAFGWMEVVGVLAALAAVAWGSSRVAGPA